MRYANVPPVIGTLVSARLASPLELQTVYGIEDAYNMLEILNIDMHNERVIRGKHNSH